MEYSHTEPANYVDVILRSTGRDPEVVEVMPALCPNGHALAGPAGRVRVGWGTAPDRVPRRSWTCGTCGVVTWGR